MSILEQFQKQVELDRQQENYDLSNTDELKSMTEDEYEEYKRTIDDLREQMYVDVPKQMSTRIEAPSFPNSLVDVKKKENETANRMDEVMTTNEDGERTFDGHRVYKTEELETHIDEIQGNLRLAIKRAKCPICGEDLESVIPTMYNPFNFNPVTPVKCKHCGEQYMVDYSYPRLVVLDENNNEIKINWY